jgi:hypothetical protein
MMLEVDDLLIGKDHNRIDGFLYIVVQRQTRLTEDVCGCSYSRGRGRALIAIDMSSDK